MMLASLHATCLSDLIQPIYLLKIELVFLLHLLKSMGHWESLQHLQHQRPVLGNHFISLLLLWLLWHQAKAPTTYLVLQFWTLQRASSYEFKHGRRHILWAFLFFLLLILPDFQLFFFFSSNLSALFVFCLHLNLFGLLVKWIFNWLETACIFLHCCFKEMFVSDKFSHFHTLLTLKNWICMPWICFAYWLLLQH